MKTNKELRALVTSTRDGDATDMGALVDFASKLTARHVETLISLAVAFRDKSSDGNDTDRLEGLHRLRPRARCDRRGLREIRRRQLDTKRSDAAVHRPHREPDSPVG